MNGQVLAKLQSFFSRYPTRLVQKRDVLIRAREEPAGIFYLRAGHVRQYTISRNGEEMTLNIFKQHTFFPMAWAVGAYASVYYFEMMEHGEVVIAPKEEVLTFLSKEPTILFDLLKRLYSGVDGLLSRLEYLMSGTARQRLIAMLLLSMRRFGAEEGNDMVIHLHLSHQDLAHLTGLSRETVSREMARLKKKGILTYKGKFVSIQNLHNLTRELIG